MDELMKFLLPGEIGVLIVFMGAINSTWSKGMQIAAEGNTTQLTNLIGDWVVFGLLVVIVLLLFGVISTVARG